MSDDSFLAAMSDVVRLKKKARNEKKQKKKIDIHEKQHAPQRRSSKVSVHRFESEFQFQEKGVSSREMQRVSNSTDIEATLDLHGLYVQTSLNACVVFLKNALRSHYRVVRIIHGRGLHSPEGKAVLKEEVFRWLKEGPYSKDILAVKPVQAGGASLIYLRRKRG
ncbi:MAG: Smr/MutS family protein [Mariprofundaceae bacterium]|nr:Smr/MutS family protein [Mariprofundaceae bacterium]